MRIDLPGCNFHECRYYADGNCVDTNRYDNCMYKYYQASYEKLLSDGDFEDQRYPEIKGYYTLLVYDKLQNKLARIGSKWNGKTFEGIDNLHTIVAWQRCS